MDWQCILRVKETTIQQKLIRSRMYRKNFSTLKPYMSSTDLGVLRKMMSD